MGFALHHLGHHHRALTCFGNALDLFRKLELRYFQGTTLDSIADTHAIGRHAEAVAAWQESLATLEQLRHPTADSVRAKLDASTALHAATSRPARQPSPPMTTTPWIDQYTGQR